MSRIAFKSLCGRKAIVTGSTSGIGFAIAKRLAREGAKVIISSRREENVREAEKQLQREGLDVKGLVCHVSDASSRQELLEEAKKAGGLDILVQAAGVNPTPTEVYNTPESSWDKNFDVNVKSSFLLSKEALGMLRQSKAGRIIFIGTVAALSPEKNLGAYVCSKAALAALTKVAAQHLGQDNITVNCILPGVIKTRFSHVLYADDELTKSRLARIPLNRSVDIMQDFYRGENHWRILVYKQKGFWGNFQGILEKFSSRRISVYTYLLRQFYTNNFLIN